MKLLLFCGIIFCAYKIISGLRQRSEKERDRKDKEEIKAELAVQKAQIQAEIERAKLETKRQIEAEKRNIEWRKHQDSINRKAEADRIRMEKEQARQAAVLEKHEAAIRKAKFDINQAQEAIDSILWKIEEQQEYAKFLEEQRDKCVRNSAEYFKWQNRLSVVDDKINKLEDRRRKAVFTKEEAERKLS